MIAFASAPRARSTDTLTALSRQPRVNLGCFPTPIERIPRRAGPDLLIKRDDLSCHGRGGAKTRKIDHLLAHLLARGHDELIAVAGNVTNLVFDLLPALDRHGIRSRLFILDDPPARPTDRAAIFGAVADRVELLGPRRGDAMRVALQAYLRSRTRGRRPFIALPGVSHPSGVAGNARGFLEMANQLEQRGEPLPSTVFVSAATGTTLAGFVLAAEALMAAGREPVRVIGVQVYPGAIRRATLALLRWTEHTLGLGLGVPASRVHTVTSRLCGGFGRFDRDLLDVCKRAREEAGIHIDPIFGAKTWSAMEHHPAFGAGRDRPVLYWHCGFTPEWRALGRAVARGIEVA